jgi:hypothetical protein
MVLPLIIGALAQLAPSIIGLFDSDSVDTVARISKTVSAVARAVTGQDTDDAALDILRADPELLVRYQGEMNTHAASLWAEETRRMRMVNETYRLELKSGDRFVRWMRPTFGYIMAAAFGVTMFSVCKTILFNPQDVAEVVGSVSELTGLFTTGLIVLGVYVHGRSREKTGGVGVLDALLSRIKRD